MCARVLSCVWLCDPIDCSPPGSSVRRISQARILEWVAISSCRGSSQPRNWTSVFCISYILAGESFTTAPLEKPLNSSENLLNKHCSVFFPWQIYLYVDLGGWVPIYDSHTSRNSVLKCSIVGRAGPGPWPLLFPSPLLAISHAKRDLITGV